MFSRCFRKLYPKKLLTILFKVWYHGNVNEERQSNSIPRASYPFKAKRRVRRGKGISAEIRRMRYPRVGCVG